MKPLLFALPIVLFPAVAHADVLTDCTDFVVQPLVSGVPQGCISAADLGSACPESGTCVIVDDEVHLDPECNYIDVTFHIGTGGTEQDPLVFDCHGAILEGSASTKTAIDLHSHGDGPLEHVVVHDCTVDGYYDGIEVITGTSTATRVKLRECNEALAYDPLLQDDVLGAIEAQIRQYAPQNIRFDQVNVRGAGNVGLYLYNYAHHITFENGSATDNGKPGIYLDSGTRLNIIRNNDISENGREGIAIDSSAFNTVVGNTIEDNDGGGIRLYRNFWEAYPQQLPRTQHAFGNTITGNTIRGSGDPGVWVAKRQSESGDTDTWHDPVYVWHSGKPYRRENAEANAITNNVIDMTGIGVQVNDDDTIMVGNDFVSSVPAIRVGNAVRKHAGEPVRGTVIMDNAFSGLWWSLPVQVVHCATDMSGSGNTVDGSSYALPSSNCTHLRSTAWAHHGTPGGFEFQSSFDRLAHRFTSGTRAIAGDFSDDDEEGNADLVLIRGTSDGQARITLHVSTGTGFESRTHYQWFPEYDDTDRWLAGDVDGDGLDDLVRVYSGIGGTATARVHRSSGEEFAYFGAPTATFGAFDPDQQWLMGDFTGDGLDDLVMVSELSQGRCWAWVMGSDGTSFAWLTSLTKLANYWPTQRWRVGDFNDDGKDDLVNVYGNGGNAVAWVHDSTGSGFEYLSTLDVLAGFWTSQQWLVTDFNDDGRDDLVNVYGSGGVARAWRHAYTGSGFEYQTGFQVLEGLFTHQRWITGDFNGDGYGDLLDVYGASGAW